MRRAYPELQAAGIDVAMVGMGTPEESAAFARELDLPYPVLSDPLRVAYREYKTKVASGGDFLSPKAGKAMLGAVLRGNRGGKPVGDVRQLGGTYVIAPDGTLRLAKPSTYAGDHATVEEILAAAR